MIEVDFRDNNIVCVSIRDGNILVQQQYLNSDYLVSKPLMLESVKRSVQRKYDEMRHELLGTCDTIKVFGIPGILEISDAIDNKELANLGIPDSALTTDITVNASGFSTYMELDPMKYNCKGDIGKWV